MRFPTVGLGGNGAMIAVYNLKMLSFPFVTRRTSCPKTLNVPWNTVSIALKKNLETARREPKSQIKLTVSRIVQKIQLWRAMLIKLFRPLESLDLYDGFYSGLTEILFNFTGYGICSCSRDPGFFFRYYLNLPNIIELTGLEPLYF